MARVLLWHCTRFECERCTHAHTHTRAFNWPRVRWKQFLCLIRFSFVRFSSFISMVSPCPSDAVANNSKKKKAKTKEKKNINFLFTIGKYEILFIYSDWTVRFVCARDIRDVVCPWPLPVTFYIIKYIYIFFSRCRWSIVVVRCSSKGSKFEIKGIHHWIYVFSNDDSKQNTEKERKKKE